MAIDEEVQRIRERIHRLNDITQAHEGSIVILQREFDALKDMMATSDQLNNALEVVTLKIEQVRRDVDAVKHAINWAVGLILSAVLIALLGLVLRSPTP